MSEMVDHLNRRIAVYGFDNGVDGTKVIVERLTAKGHKRANMYPILVLDHLQVEQLIRLMRDAMPGLGQ